MSATRDELLAKIASVPHWYHRIEVAPGVVTPGSSDSSVLPFLNPPDDCRGLRVLDLGTRDGFFAFEYEKRGAQVVAVDYMPRQRTGFGVAAELLRSRVEYIQANLYHLAPDRLGTFDVVLFLGLLYHLPDPLGAIHRVRTFTRGVMFMETQLLDNAVVMADGSVRALRSLAPDLIEAPLLQFYPGRSLANDPTNYFAPNVAAVHAMLFEAGFRVEAQVINAQRGIFRACPEVDAEREHFLRAAEGTDEPRF